MTATTDLAGKVVAELADGWQVTANPHDHRDEPYLIQGDGPDVPHISLYRYGDRLTLTGIYPRGRRIPEDLERKHVEISVGFSRPPAAIAGEIRRRLLPDYLTNLQAVLEYDQRCQDEDQTRVKNAERLAQIIPGGYVQEFPPQWGKRTSHRVVVHPEGGGSVTAEMATDGQSVSLLEARGLPVSLVEELLARLDGRLL